MRNGFLAGVPGVLIGVSLVLGQPPQPMPEAPPPETAAPPLPAKEPAASSEEGKSTPAEPAETGSAPPHGFFDDLASHFAGTCAPTNGNVLTTDLDYLFWVMKNPRLSVPLASTNAEGAPGNVNLIGGGQFEYDHRPNSGLRLSVAYWQADPVPELEWDKPRTFAIEGNFLYLPQRALAMRNDTAPTLIRPFFDLNDRVESGYVVAAPGISNGGITVDSNYSLWGGEVNLWKNVYYEYPGRTIRIDALVGFRYLDLDEGLAISTLSLYNQQPLQPFTQFAGSQILVNDLFYTRNQFYGGQIGAVTKFFLDALDMSIAFKIAFGENVEQVYIDGYQLRTANGTTTATSGGVLALPSNIGRHNGTQFAVVPEVDVLGHYQFCRHVGLAAGYTFLYWGRVARPEYQIDRVIDVTQIPNFPTSGIAPTGLARPSVPFKQTDYWTQGLTVRLEFVW
jgi:hypothetical protein